MSTHDMGRKIINNGKSAVSEKGFTLVELLVALAILAVVVATASMAIITMMRLSPQSRDWTIALHQVQNAGHWISRDVEMSQTVTVGTDPTFLTLTVPQTSTTSNTVIYQFESMAGGLKKLIRNDQTAGQQTMIAEYISDSSATYYGEDRKVVVTIAATSGDTTVSRKYQAAQRVSAP